MNFFEHTKYRDIIVTELNRNSHRRGYRGTLAAAGGFQPAYLSQILSGSANLTPDQGNLLCEFWEYDERMSEFFLTLLHHERATTESLKRRLERKLLKIRVPIDDFRNLNIDDISAEQKNAQIFFSSCDYAAVLSSLDIAQVNTEEDVADLLKLRQEHARLILSKLEEMQLIKRSGNKWSQTKSDHLVMQNNRYLSQNFINSLNFKFNQSYTVDYQSSAYAAVIPMSHQNYNTIRDQLKEVMRSAADDPGKPSEIVAGLNLSLFRF